MARGAGAVNRERIALDHTATKYGRRLAAARVTGTLANACAPRLPSSWGGKGFKSG